MPDALKYVPFSNLVSVNPRTPLQGKAVPFVGMEDVSEEGQLLRVRERATDELSPGQPSFQDGDVLFAKITPCMENGKGAYVAGVGERAAFGSTEFHVLRAKSGTSPRFVYHWTRSRHFRRAAEAMMIGTAGQRRVPAEFFGKHSVPKFTLPEQQRVAEILDAVDDQINAAEEVITKIKRVNSGFMSDLLSRVDTLTRPLSDFLATRPRNGFSPNETDSWSGVLALGLGCLTTEGFVPRQLKNVPARDARYAGAWLSDGDLLISRSNTYDLVGLVGRYRDVGVPCVYPDLMMKLTPNSLVRPEFLEFVLRNVEAREQIKRMSQGTSGSMVKISGASLVKIQVKIPDLAEQDRMLAIFAAQKAQLAALERENAKSRLLKQGLMQDLLTGLVRVSDLGES